MCVGIEWRRCPMFIYPLTVPFRQREEHFAGDDEGTTAPLATRWIHQARRTNTPVSKPLSPHLELSHTGTLGPLSLSATPSGETWISQPSRPSGPGPLVRLQRWTVDISTSYCLFLVRPVREGVRLLRDRRFHPDYRFWDSPLPGAKRRHAGNAAWVMFDVLIINHARVEVARCSKMLKEERRARITRRNGVILRKSPSPGERDRHDS